ncbi:MAG: 3-deoxy-7-phosphoheptulonate synthase [Candidatus Nitronauta litoralis]|uniref:3-deoxy-7-phosphoheptulonate synthase n=1 Tax=Candidatus Nitronauta litoralis TaxID=2705533 RepID=A0A7T0BVL7_9BACT|nr:MAG: 3-deoxy-7-phosphoheptulonate synthase [Candidatus Nitronauta litoralis]
MIVVLKPDAKENEIQAVQEKIKNLGYQTHEIIGVERRVIGAVGKDDQNKEHAKEVLETMPGVENVIPIQKPYKLAGREIQTANSEIKVDNMVVGGKRIALMAGPCSVESRDQLQTTAKIVKNAGANFLRGGAFKPRTSPYSFQGLEEEGLKLLKEAKEMTGLPIVTEVMNPREVDLVARYADILQVGARNVQNFSLLKELGALKKPILLKRGLMTTIKEFLMSAEYILSEGNKSVILCERGIRTFETATRNTLDISAVPVLKKETHLPIIIDPSHGTGHWDLVQPMAMAAIAAGADGLMIEVHPDPINAFSDGPQSLKPVKFENLVDALKPLLTVMGRTL